MAGYVDVIFRVNNAAVKTGFEQVKQQAASLRSDLVTQFAGAFAAGAIVASLKSVADEYGRINDLSSRGLGDTDSLQRAGFAASQYGSDLETVAKAISKVTVNAVADRKSVV